MPRSWLRSWCSAGRRRSPEPASRRALLAGDGLLVCYQPRGRTDLGGHTPEVSLQTRDGLGQVGPPEADPEVIAGMPETGSGQEQNAFRLDQLGAEPIDVEVFAHAREADGAAARPDPRQRVRPTSEKRVQGDHVLGDERLRPVENDVPRT